MLLDNNNNNNKEINRIFENMHVKVIELLANHENYFRNPLEHIYCKNLGQ